MHGKQSRDFSSIILIAIFFSNSDKVKRNPTVVGRENAFVCLLVPYSVSLRFLMLNFCLTWIEWSYHYCPNLTSLLYSYSVNGFNWSNDTVTLHSRTDKIKRLIGSPQNCKWAFHKKTTVYWIHCLQQN